MNKVVRDGKVAVLYSPGFGAGWYTWNQEHPELIFDPGIVDLLENNKQEELLAYVTLKWPDLYLGGLDDLTIFWMNQGTQFKINEYDGSESIEFKENIMWLTA
jgi:hypothetical protein